jgi:choline-sulfatase
VGKHASLRIGSEYSDHLAAKGLLEPYREWLHGHRYAAYDAGTETSPNWAVGSVPLPTEDYADVWVGDRAVRWIEEYDRDEPWFLWVGFPGPHDPWDGPAEYVERYRDVAMPMPRSTERPDTASAGPFEDFLAFCLWIHSSSETFTDERIEEVRRYYYANVTLIDDAIARIVAALERRGLADDTWIVYTSDHGEMMGEHRMLMKMVFYEQATRVPLVIRPPGGMAPVVDDRLAEQIDIPATCRAIAGVGGTGDRPVGDAGFAGRSLLERLEGGGEGRSEVWSENFGFAMVRTDHHKLVFHEDTLTPAQLFDLAADPTEDHNLAHDPSAAGVVEELLDTKARPFLAGGRNVPGPSILDGEEAQAIRGRKP